MKVTLLNAAAPTFYYITLDDDDDDNFVSMDTNFEYLVEQATALCVGKLDNPTKKGMMTALDSGHLSVLEHLPLTFLVEDISRACSHQLVRHRIASYSQQSQRYSKVKNDVQWFVEPKSIKDSKFYEEYLDVLDHIESLYNKMTMYNEVSSEDARYILPNACFTSIIISMNARSFVEASEKRLCNRAQWEIREMFYKMKELIKDIYPTVYSMCKPPCETNKGCIEIKPCSEWGK